MTSESAGSVGTGSCRQLQILPRGSGYDTEALKRGNRNLGWFSLCLSVSVARPSSTVPSANEVHDLHFVAFIDDDRIERGAFENHEIELDGYAPRIDRQVREQLGHRQGARQLIRLAIQSDSHEASVYTPRSPVDCLPAARSLAALQGI